MRKLSTRSMTTTVRRGSISFQSIVWFETCQNGIPSLHGARRLAVDQPAETEALGAARRARRHEHAARGGRADQRDPAAGDEDAGRYRGGVRARAVRAPFARAEGDAAGRGG